MSEADGDRSPDRFPRLVVRAVCGLAAGAMPGALIAAFVSSRPGIAVILLGMPIGLVVAFGFAAPQRLVRLLLAVFVAKNIPFLQDSALDWVDQGTKPDPKSESASSRLLQWLMPEGAHERRGRWVLCALIAGIVCGGALMARDVGAVQVGRPGFLLPLAGAKDPLITQAVLVTLAIGIWMAAAMGILASVVYRRPILLTAAIAGYVSACIVFAADDGRGAGAVNTIVLFTTLPVGFVLLITAVITIGEKSADDASAGTNEEADGGV